MKKIIPLKKDKKKIPLWLILVAGGGLLISLLVIGLIVAMSISQNSGTLDPTIEQPPVQLDNIQPKEEVKSINFGDLLSFGQVSNTEGPNFLFWFIILFPLVVVALSLIRGIDRY